MISGWLNQRARVRLELAIAVAIAAGLGVAAAAQAQVGGGAAAPGDPEVTGIQCVTRCINSMTGTVKSKIRLTGHGSSGAGFGAARSGHSHQGQDVMASCGIKLVAIHSGRVKAAGFQSSAGNYVVIDADGVKQDHLYMHMQSAPRVGVGQRVTTGQKLGKVGATGNAQGCHLHFEIWAGKGWYSGGSPIDPQPHLRYWDSYS